MNLSFDLTNENNSFSFDRFDSFDLHASIASEKPLSFERKNIRRFKHAAKFPWSLKEWRERKNVKK